MPSQPKNVRTKLEGVSLLVRWDAPDEENGVMTKYRVCIHVLFVKGGYILHLQLVGACCLSHTIHTTLYGYEHTAYDMILVTYEYNIFQVW